MRLRDSATPRLRDSDYVRIVFSPKASLKSGSGAWHGPSVPVPASAEPLGRASAHRLAPSVTIPQPFDPMAWETRPVLGQSSPIVRPSASRLGESSPLVPPPAPPLGESGPMTRQSAPMLPESALMVRHESPSLASEKPSLGSKPMKKRALRDFTSFCALYPHSSFVIRHSPFPTPHETRFLGLRHHLG